MMFEVQDLKYATPATTSRCRVVWFSEDVLTIDMIFDNFLSKLRNVSIDEAKEIDFISTPKTQEKDTIFPAMQVHTNLW